jgi:hypothetical protein
MDATVYCTKNPEIFSVLNKMYRDNASSISIQQDIFKE